MCRGDCRARRHRALATLRQSAGHGPCGNSGCSRPVRSGVQARCAGRAIRIPERIRALRNRYRRTAYKARTSPRMFHRTHFASSCGVAHGAWGKGSPPPTWEAAPRSFRPTPVPGPSSQGARTRGLVQSLQGLFRQCRCRSRFLRAAPQTARSWTGSAKRSIPDKAAVVQLVMSGTHVIVYVIAFILFFQPSYSSST